MHLVLGFTYFDQRCVSIIVLLAILRSSFPWVITKAIFLIQHMGFYFLRYYARRVTFFIVWSTSKLPIVVIFFLLGWFLGMDHWYAFRFTNISLFIDELLRGLKHQLQGTHPPIFIVVFFIRFSCYFTFFAFVDDTATFSTFVNVVAVDLSRSLRLYQASMLFLQFKRVI